MPIESLAAGPVVSLVERLAGDSTPEVTTLVFQQPFSNADGSGATGGTTDDPTTLFNCQIAGGVFQGVTPVTGATGDESGVFNTLTVPTASKATVMIQTASQFTANYFNVIRITDSSGSVICALFIEQDGVNTKFSIFDKSTNEVAVIFLDVPFTTSGTIFFFTFEIDLILKTLNVLSDVGISNNLGLDISDGGAMVSTNVGKVFIQALSALPGGDSRNIKYDNLLVYSIS